MNKSEILIYITCARPRAPLLCKCVKKSPIQAAKYSFSLHQFCFVIIVVCKFFRLFLCDLQVYREVNTNIFPNCYWSFPNQSQPFRKFESLECRRYSGLQPDCHGLTNTAPVLCRWAYKLITTNKFWCNGCSAKVFITSITYEPTLAGLRENSLELIELYSIKFSLGFLSGNTGDTKSKGYVFC